MNLEKIESLAKENNLDYREVTAGTNGYPVPLIGGFIGGFENFKAVEDFKKQHGGEIAEVDWRDGWHNCKLLTSTVIEGYKGTEAADENDIIFNSLEEIEEFNADEPSKIINDMIEKSQNLDFDQNFIVYYAEAESWDIFPRSETGHSYDTHNFSIGIYFEIE